MGIACDTVAAFATNPGAVVTAATVTPGGDSLTVRAFNPASSARLESISRMGAAAGKVGVRSPLLHDPVTGIRAARPAGLSAYALPRDFEQALQSNDALIVEMTGGAAETDACALTVYYDDLRGAAADLRMPGDIQGQTKYIKSIPVSAASSGAATKWNDLALNSAEDLLHAGKSYAVLGFLTDAAMMAIGIKGACTGNLRVTGPGLTSGEDTYEYFVRESERTGRPHIPVFNANDKAATFVSFIDAAGGVTPNITLLVAELMS
jgi:hypothetical protein